LPFHSGSQVSSLGRIKWRDQTAKKFAGALAKFLSVGQKETGMTGRLERHQIINTPKNLYKPGALPTSAWRLPRVASPLLKGVAQTNTGAVE
jgi:hypothetical protein